MIYLDNASTTQVDPEVLEEMLPYLREQYGNPGTIYSLGRAAWNAVGTARQRVASLIGADPSRIIFTSGGSEANNLAIRGVVRYLSSFGEPRIVTSRAEHTSVLRAVASVPAWVQYVHPNSEGWIEPRMIGEPPLSKSTLVCLMKTNNETGAETPVEEIGRICEEHGALFHTDCVQALSGQSIDVKEIKCTSLSMSSHKIHGPKGVGALYTKLDYDKIDPVVYGGSLQEFGLRGGTENVAGIVGFGKSCELLQQNRQAFETKTSTLKQRFYGVLKDRLQDAGLSNILHVNGGPVIHRGKTLNLRFQGVDAQTLILMLDARGICVSAGSACTGHSTQPSHVLKAMGLSDEDAFSSVRFSFSRMNTEDEVDLAAQIVAECVQILAGVRA